jgi:hypothetical protein
MFFLKALFFSVKIELENEKSPSFSKNNWPQNVVLDEIEQV